MGIGTIDSELGEGEYTISLDYGAEIIEEKITTLTSRIDTLDALTTSLEADKVTAQNNVSTASSELNQAIDDYAAAQSGGGEPDQSAVKEKTALLAEARVIYDLAELAYNKNLAAIAQATASIEYFEGFELESTIDAWCTDYTLDASGQVGTIEIPGEPVQTILVPDCASPVASDGLVTARPAQSSEQLYLNLAILPGWQKFSPTYRVGALNYIDRDADTCTVALDNATSSAQALDINQEATLYEVPIVYMNCHSRAFEYGDRVVVQFIDQDWEQPQVIGFESNPKSCYVGVGRFARILFVSNDPELALITQQNYILVRTDEYGEFGDEMVDEMRRSLFHDSLAVEFRMEGDTDWTRMNATGFHIPSPEGPGGVVYRGPGYTIVPGGDDIQDGHLWIDDLRRFEEEDPDPESFEGQLSYGYDEDYRATIGMAVEDFPGYETKKIEVRISRYNEAFNPVMRTFVHFTTEYSPAEVLMWGINEIDWMTYEFFDHLPISFMEGYSFPLPDDPPDYWP